MKLKEWAPIDIGAYLEMPADLQVAQSLWNDPCDGVNPIINNPYSGPYRGDDIKNIWRDRGEPGRFTGASSEEEEETPLQERLRNKIRQEISKLFQQRELEEGSCGYTHKAPGGKMLTTPGDTKGMDAYTRTQQMTKGTLQERFKKLANIK